MSSLLLSARPDARHHGRYGSEGQFCRDTEAALVADLCNGLCLAGVAGDDRVRGVYPDKGMDVPVVCNVWCWP